jgi:hypothetical protein
MIARRFFSEVLYVASYFSVVKVLLEKSKVALEMLYNFSVPLITVMLEFIDGT